MNNIQSKMKFITESLTKCAPRVGVLKDIENIVNLELETPLALLYTRGGSLPHITYEVFKLICDTPKILQIPLVSTYQFHEVMQEFNGNISDFVGMRDCLTCVTVQDPGDLTQPGHHVKDHIPLWTRNGKVLLNADQYISTVEAFRPNMYYFMSDGDTNIKSPAKRVAKAVENTIRFYESCLAKHKNSDVLSKAFVMAPIAGGYCNNARKKCIDAVTKDDVVGGFLIDGLHNNGPEVEFMPFDEPKSVIEFVVNNLPENKLRVVQGCYNPTVIMKFVQLGLDVFDTSYCNLVTERSSALVFNFDLADQADSDLTYEINLRQPQFAEEFKPISEKCTCLTCKKHTRAYIHHLVTVQELLGPLLLTIHNTHHFLMFFEKIRECIRNETVKELDALVEKQFMLHQDSQFKGKKLETIEGQN